ncbi:MAG TPA: alkaline phosphatase family protein [Verrucomicrobiae bacterium]|nr:alkaline phosphatase family protein [Verrucomicrobiae bacterium]
MCPRFLLVLVICAGSLVPAKAFARGKAEHVVMVVWDGMRPDFITPQYTPVLFELAAGGTFFARNHPVYVSTTEVNGTALATGMFPEHSGIIANTEYRPDFNWLSSYATEALEVVRRGDAASQGHYLQAATVAELIHAAGFPTIVAGAKPIALLHDRAPRKVSQAEKDSVTLFRGQTLPKHALDSLVKARDVGPFPGADADSSDAGSSRGRRRRAAEATPAAAGPAPAAATNSAASRGSLANSIDSWTTRALARGLWKNGLPKFSVLWLSEPDAAQHAGGVGSDVALEALASSDDQLGAVLKALEEKNALDSTDVIVVSDHGFSTIDRGPDIMDSLKRSKFNAGVQFQNPEAGDILVDNLGGSVFFYVFEHDEAVIKRLVGYLQGTDFAGVIFCALPIEGTFRLSDVHLAATNGAPDVVVSMRWNSEPNEYGAKGLVTSLEGRPGQGTHGSLSPFDMHNTLVASGPDFKKQFVSGLPSGNIDVAPTILWILGIAPETAGDGRVLYEALANAGQEPLKPVERTLEAHRDLGVLSWHQSLKTLSMGNAVYYEEGNGESRMKQP